ncbi:MAG: TM0106 family RecB-like putative nuclease, partial [Candidatus Eremiobacteraeota bacterium]|nr:TM0106 family RecB-like putative nuclease [Candidatus Eremiobacteraeota bacterium]
MQKIGDRIIYSASDLNKYLECDYLLALDLEALRGKLQRPEQTDYSKLITSKGIKHEARHLENERGRWNGGVIELPSETNAETIADFEAAEAETRKAMEKGTKVIYQAAFFDGQWFGRADFLQRVDDRPSNLGDYSYEVVDTKLALHTKPYFIIQLCFYSAQLARVQGAEPHSMHVVLGNGEQESHRVGDYSAYFAHLQDSFLREMVRLESLEDPSTAIVPMPVKHCEVCAWDAFCVERRGDADHLTLVARLRSDQVRKLESAGIKTLAELAAATDVQRPPQLREGTFNSLREQAQLQEERRNTGRHKHVLLPLEDERGFALLPEPDEGDVFFDMEGDPLYEASGNLYYLFGAYMPKEDDYCSFWARDPSEEKPAFEQFVDFVVERRKRYPKLHVYHYAPYEKTALRTLSVKYETREADVDDFLRGEVLVDLYAVVRQTMRISQPRYGIKYVEPLYGFTREGDVRAGD